MKRDECGRALHEIPMRRALWRDECYTVNTDSHLVFCSLRRTQTAGRMSAADCGEAGLPGAGMQ